MSVSRDACNFTIHRERDIVAKGCIRFFLIVCGLVLVFSLPFRRFGPILRESSPKLEE